MTFDTRLCAGCPIEGMYDPIPQIGPEDARFLVVTDRPSQAAAAERRLMTTAQIQVFSAEAMAVQLERENFRFTPFCHCGYDQDSHHNKEKKAIHKHCRQHLLAEIERGSCEVVVPLGAEATTQVFGRGTLITKVRGMAQRSEEFRQQVFPLLSPALVVRYPQNAPLFRADMASFGRFVDADYVADNASAMADSSVEYTLIDDLQFLIDMQAEVLSFDTENTGLRWYQGGCNVRTYRPNLHKGSPLFRPRFQILSMQFSVEPGKAYMLLWDHPEAPIPEQNKPRMRNQLRRLLCNPDTLVVGQNTKYDNVALWKTEGIRFRIGGDTMMLATLTDENQQEKNLDVLTKIHVPEMAGYADRFNATVDKSRMWEVPVSTLVPYGCGDSDAALRLYGVLEAKVAEDEKLWNHYCRVSIPGLNAFAGMETKGMHIDEDDALADFKQVMHTDVERVRVELLEQIPRQVKRDVIADYTSKPGNRGPEAVEKAVSFTRADFLKQVLFEHPRGFRLTPRVFTKSTARLKDESLREPSVSAKDHLPYFFDTCPFAMQLAEYVKDHSLLTKSVISFEKKYIVGKKVRPTYHLHKAVTGRTSSEDPNGQNYPKRGARAKAYRKMFVAPPGYFVCENDLSQAELRIAACMSGDRTMIDIYNSGGDIHISTACIILNVTAEVFETLAKAIKKEARQKAKAVNFGFLYGMGWRKFIGYAKTQYNVTFTEDEARRVRSGFFQKYRSLDRWHLSMRAFANRYKYVRSFSGRIRHLPMIESSEEGIRMEAERQAINSPVQEFGSSLGVMSLGRINEEIDPEHLQIVGFIHDAIVYYVRKEYLDWGMKTVKRYMETTPVHEWFGTELQVPIVADVGFGLNLGEIHECEHFSLEEPFNYGSLRAEDGSPLIEVPPQRIPPNDGRLTRPPYTLPEDEEDENVVVQTPTRSRYVRATLSPQAIRRIEIGAKQVVINRRNLEKRRELEREQRASKTINRRR